MALLMVMTLYLLVYSALQWRIRQGLKEKDRSYPDQKGNPTQRPTARWVFQNFEGIHVLYAGQQRMVLNMKQRHQTVIPFWGRTTSGFMYLTRHRGCGTGHLRATKPFGNGISTAVRSRSSAGRNASRLNRRSSLPPSRGLTLNAGYCAVTSIGWAFGRA